MICEFPFVGGPNNNGIYIIFSFKPMHTLHPGVSKVLKECAMGRPEDLSLKSKSTFPGMTARTFSSIIIKVKFQLSTFLRSVQISPKGYGLRLNLSKTADSNSEGFLYKKWVS